MDRKKAIIFLFCCISLFIFWKFFLFGLLPFPGNFLLAWFEPWKSSNFQNNAITLAHKPVADDVFRQIFPFKVLAMDLIKGGSMPLWNPYNGAGQPLFATINIGFLDPFNILYFFLPNEYAWSIYIILQPFLIGYFTYLYAKKISLSTTAAFFSAITFVFSGFTIARLIFGMYGLAIAILPLLLYFLESFIQNKHSRNIYLLPIFVFLLTVITQPQITFYVLSFTLLYALIRLSSLGPKIHLKQLFFIISLYILGIGTASIQLLPTYELYKYSNVRTETSGNIFNEFLLPFNNLIAIIIPNYFGNLGTYNYWGKGDYVQTVNSIGIISCFFIFISLFGIVKQKSIFKNFYVLAIIVTIAMTLDWLPARIVSSLPIPLISTGVPSRIFMLTTFSGAILAGIGYQEWLEKKRVNMYSFISYTTIIFIILFYTLFLLFSKKPCPSQFIPQCYDISLRNTLLQLAVFLPVAFALFFFQRLHNKLKHALPIGIILLVIFLGLYNSEKYLPFSPRDSVLPEIPLLSALFNNTRDGRVFGLGGGTIPTNFATHFRFYDPQYYHPLYITRYRELLEFANTGELKEILPRGDANIRNDIAIKEKPELKKSRNTLLSILSVKYLIYKNTETLLEKEKIVWRDNTWTVVENQKALPRAYLVTSYEIKKNKKDILERLFNPSFAVTESVILENNPGFKSHKGVNKRTSRTVKIDTYRENEVFLQVVTDTNALLVLTDNYYPGWKAYVDGRETKVFRANYTFRAIVIPSGSHLVEFKYEPKSLMIGFIFSITAICSYLAWLFWPKISSKKN